MPRLTATVLLLVSAAVGLAQPAADPKPLPPKEAKAAFLKLLDRPQVPPDVKADPLSREAGRVVERLSFASEKKADGTVERVPVLVVRSARPSGDTARRPCVVVLHGTGGSKERVRDWLDEFADAGFVAVGVDARYHGDRVPGVKGSAAYVGAITRAWRTPAGKPHEHPFYYDTCWDLWRLLDYLGTRPDVDPARIGMVGISMGGIQTWLAGACDDRVAVACPLIAVQSLRWSLANDQWLGRAKTIWAAHEAAAADLGEPAVTAAVCRNLWGKVVPGITSDFDCPNLLPLIAPRPLFVANGENDPNCPLPGAELAARAAEAAYSAAGRRDRFVFHVARGVAHKVTEDQRRACVAFCHKWLK